MKEPIYRAMSNEEMLKRDAEIRRSPACSYDFVPLGDSMAELIRLAVEAEREACARIAEVLQPLVNDDGESVAAAIRARI